MFWKIDTLLAMSVLPWLNYQHLYYFMIIAHEGGVSHAAKRLRISQSNLSTQLRLLEESFGSELFHREGRRLKLSPQGEVALGYAEEIFRKGDELRHHFSSDKQEGIKSISIGALSPLSKNLQYEVIRPIIENESISVRVIEGELPDLLERLKHRQIDILLSNLPSRALDSSTLSVHVLGEMPMYLVASPQLRRPDKKFPFWLKKVPLFLPTTRTSARVDFDAILVRSGINPIIKAEIDDTALLRLLALSGRGVALLPEIGVKLELQENRLLKIEKVPKVFERFYAITMRQKSASHLINDLIFRAQESLMEAI